MKRLTAFLLVVVLTLITVTSVFAVPPYINSGSWIIEEFLVDCSNYGDWDFEVWDRYVNNWQAIHHFDQEGNWTHSSEHINGDSSLYVPDDNSGKEIASKFSMNWLLYPDPKAQGKGNVYNVVLPGYGNLYKYSGSIWFEGGQPVRFVGIIDADFLAICEYLAP